MLVDLYCNAFYSIFHFIAVPDTKFSNAQTNLQSEPFFHELFASLKKIHISFVLY